MFFKKSIAFKYIFLSKDGQHFDVALADLEQIIINDFLQLGGESLNVNNYLSRGSKKFEIIFT